MKSIILFFVPICASLLLVSCSKEYSCEGCYQPNSTPPPLPVSPGDSTLYYQFSIGSRNYQAIAFENNFIVGTNINYDGTAGLDSGVIIGSALLQPNTTPAPMAPLTLGISRGIIKYYNNIPGDQFRSLFSTGNYSFASLRSVAAPYTPLRANGFALIWVDENGKIWRTDNLPGDQPGNHFEVTSRKDIQYSWGSGPVRLRITANFTCRLYDELGQFIELKNGRIAYYFAKDF